MIHFDAETHTYTVDGRRVPSVTQLLQQAGLSPDYGSVDPNVLLHARERGIHVEACCQLWSEGTLDEVSVHPEARSYLDAFGVAVVAERITNMRWQVIGYCGDDNVAGTTDLLCNVNNFPSVIDVKCVWKLDRSYRIQLAAYRRMHEPALWRRRYVLQLQKKGTYVLLDCDAEERREGTNDEQTWLACVQLAKWKAAVAGTDARGIGGRVGATAAREAT